MANIDEELNKIKHAIYGKEVRSAIHDGIEKVYNDATKYSGEKDMEVVLARGSHSNLKDRLNKTDQKLAQKATKEEVNDLDENKATKAALSLGLNSKRDKDVEIGMSDLDQETKEAFTGGSVPVVGENSVGTVNLINNSVTTDKLDREVFVKNYLSDSTYDLDYIWERGSYVVSLDAINVPTNSSGTLEVVRHKTAIGGEVTWVTQTFTAYTSSSNDSGKTFRRVFSVVEDEGRFVFEGDWLQLSNPDKITNEILDEDVFFKEYLSDDTIDLDYIWEQGNYIVSSPVENNPYPVGGALIVQRFKTAKNSDLTWITQDITAYGSQFYERYRGRHAVRILAVNEATEEINYMSEWSDDRVKPIKILTIGNSFGLDATRYIPWISREAGINVMVGNLYISGGLLSEHDDNIKNNNKSYSFYSRYHVDGAITNDSIENYSVDDALDLEEWDYVFFNQASAQSGVYDTFQPYLNDIISYVKSKQPNIKIALMPTWAYSSDFDDSRFDKYDRNQLTMYNDISEAYKNVMSEVEFDVIIPAGTAIQNARTDNYIMGIERELTLDGYHLSDAGGFIACVTLFKTLVDDRVDIDYVPSAIDKRAAYFGKVAVENAVLNPFQITEI